MNLFRRNKAAAETPSSSPANLTPERPEQAPSSTPLLDAVLAQHTPTEEQLVDAPVDGKRVIIEGQDEIILRCGQASITLRRNGRVVIKGIHLESHASGTHRIKGGSVQVN